jgi:uncharacterized protein (DUF1778 family)
MNRREESIRVRVKRSDKQLLLRLAKSERRTMSNFIINLIHERQALVNRLAATRDGTVDPVKVNVNSGNADQQRKAG